jgi:predicted permease
MGHLSLALRALRATPFVTAVAVLSLALGIGANAAIYSLVEQTLLRPLPVHDVGTLVNLGAPGPKPGGTSCNTAGDCDEVFSYPMFRDLERRQTVFTGIAAHRAFDANLAFQGRTLNARGMLVSGSYFPVLGLAPAAGRLIGPNDDRVVGGHPVAVLTHTYWANQLGADPGVVGRTLVVNGHPMTVIGVAPRGFDGTTLGERPNVFVPISMRAQTNPGWKGFDDRRSYWAYLFARLRPGVDAAAAGQQVNAVYRALLADVELPLQEGMSERTRAEFRARRVTLEPGARGQTSVDSDARTPLTLLFGITAVVLLIACANIANLLLARGARREGEMAVRMSLGAGRGALVAQLLTEAAVLAALGGAAGLVVARWTLAGIGAILPADASDTVRLALDWRVVAFATGVALVTAVVFGLFPALHSTRPDLIGAVRASAGQVVGATRAAARFRSGLVTAQIALSMALLVSAGLFVKSLRNVTREKLGLDVERVVTFALSPELNGYKPAAARALLDRVRESVAATPGVAGVAESLVPLLAGDNWGNDMSVEGFKRGPDTDANARFTAVSAGFFRTLNVPLRAGREFTEADGPGAPRVAVVNEAFARKFGLGRAAVGKRIAVGDRGALDIEIVGVVPDVKYSAVKDTTPPVYYAPVRQDTTVGGVTFYVRTTLPPEQILRAVPAIVKRLDPNLPVVELKTMPQQVRDNTFLDRMTSTLSAAFATLATLLAAVGLYGVLGYTVAQRTREIGVRMALGASARDVRGIVLGQVRRMLLVGGAVGLVAALGIGRAAAALLFGLQGYDPYVLAGAAALLSAVALGAGYLPARGAARVSPVLALRHD